MRFDMHCHSKEGSVDGKVPLEEFISILKEKGYDGMLISDHNSYKGYRWWEKHLKDRKFQDFVVLKGIEYDTIDAGHMLVIMPENVNLKILELRGLPIQLLIEIVHKNGGILGPAHPFGEKYLSIMNTRRRKNQLAVMDKFDFLEGFNACESVQSNKNASALAKQFEKPQIGGSDAHRADCVGLGFTDFGCKIYSESDAIRCIRAKRIILCGGNYYKGTTKEKIGRANHILVESFWVYNRLGSLLRHYKRRAEIHKLTR